MKLFILKSQENLFKMSQILYIATYKADAINGISRYDKWNKFLGHKIYTHLEQKSQVLRNLTERDLEYSHDRNCIFNVVCIAKIIINKALGFIVSLVLHWHPWLFEENLSTKRDRVHFFCHTIGFSIIPSIKSYCCSMLAQIPETGGMW